MLLLNQGGTAQNLTHSAFILSPPAALMRAPGNPWGSSEHSLKITILTQPLPFTIGEMKPREATWLAWGYTASQQPRQSPYLPSSIFPWWHLSPLMNYLLFLQTVCVFVFVCLHPSPVFPRKPNKPVPAFTLKLGVCNLDIRSWLPRRAGSTGQKGRGLSMLSCRQPGDTLFSA